MICYNDSMEIPEVVVLSCCPNVVCRSCLEKCLEGKRNERIVIEIEVERR